MKAAVNDGLKFFKQPRVLAFLSVFLISAVLIILVNYFTIRTLSAVRAYINGESHYSKAQKDATHFLVLYINTEVEDYWTSYLHEIKTPLGDSLARVALKSGSNDEIAQQGFLAGRNHPEDIDDMIWLFRNFSDISFMRDAIQVWKEADVLIGQEIVLSQEAWDRINSGKMTSDDKMRLVEKLNVVTSSLTLKERYFGDLMGIAARKINVYLFFTNIFMVTLIIGSASGYGLFMIKRMRNKNKELAAANQHLDKFVYSASHDLRAPLNSLKGLIQIARKEEEPGQIIEYLGLMEQSLDKQDKFIHDIIDYSRNKGSQIQFDNIDLEKIVDECFAQHQYMPGAKDIAMMKEIGLREVRTDPVRLKIILNNLLSNSIKYCDLKKNEKYIKVKTYSIHHNLMIQFSDNGVGIERENLDRVFEMFFGSVGRGSGLGLHITKETVEKLGGTIMVESHIGFGTSFFVSIPLHRN